jgi:hypothetical protein
MPRAPHPDGKSLPDKVLITWNGGFDVRVFSGIEGGKRRPL